MNLKCAFGFTSAKQAEHFQKMCPSCRAAKDKTALKKRLVELQPVTNALRCVLALSARVLLQSLRRYSVPLQEAANSVADLLDDHP